MPFQPEAVAHAVEEALAISGSLDDPPRRRVDVAARDARSGDADRRVVRLEDDAMNLALLRARLADHGHARGIGFVAIDGRAQIEQDQVARRELSGRRLQVGQRRVGA